VTACSIAMPKPFELPLPANTVGWVHTHPYEEGDDIGAICGKDEKIPYDGRASKGDIQTQRGLVNNALQQGYIESPADFTTLVLDEDGIRETNGLLGYFENVDGDDIKDNTNDIEPCGYK